MFESFLSVGLLALLVLLLGLNVSRLRMSISAKDAQALESDPASSLRKAIRAHGNAAEYAPMLAIVIYALGQRDPSFLIEMTMYGAVAARYLHAAGALLCKTTHTPHPLRMIGAIGTYGCGVALAVALLLEAPEVF